MKIRYIVLITVVALFTGACSTDGTEKGNTTVEEVVLDVPVFNVDSAYNFVVTQVNAGARIPGSKVHREVGDYLVSKLSGYGAKVTEQKFDASAYDGTQFELRNIIGAFYPERSRRILLAAHWDSRPFADKDEFHPEEPMEGANDGASGVAVLLEIARQISMAAPPQVGVDVIFFDGEDWGERFDENSVRPPEGLQSWWCLGSQYWSKNKHEANYAAYYGILLDMVGAKGSQFYQEGVSLQKAPKIVKKVWERAAKLGYSGIFVNKRQAGITDDHVFVNEIAKIPMINIVHYDPEEGYFGDYHHTLKDNLSLIDKNMLGIVGSTVLNVVFYE